MPTPTAVHETWTPTTHHLVHAFETGVDTGPETGRLTPQPAVVILPGLGLPQYVFPTVEALVRAGVPVTVLDLPGFGAAGRHGCPPDVHAVGRAAAEWVEAQELTSPVVLLGHSTGSQAALDAALQLQEGHERLGLVLAGPTFTPRQRRLVTLATATVGAYRRDSPAELVVVPTALREAAGVWSVLRSGMRDRPEDRVPLLRVPVTLTAGVADSFAPEHWLRRLAEGAVASPSVTVRVLPGSHNNPFTQPEELAGVVLDAVARATSPSG
jgi:pimeloyl-ACP methyl ester carboxylesterase